MFCNTPLQNFRLESSITIVKVFWPRTLGLQQNPSAWCSVTPHYRTLGLSPASPLLKCSGPEHFACNKTHQHNVLWHPVTEALGLNPTIIEMFWHGTEATATPLQRRLYCSGTAVSTLDCNTSQRKPCCTLQQRVRDLNPVRRCCIVKALSTSLTSSESSC